ncbi:11971_t:CDS:1, partial [Gigaspora margarita]
MAEKFHIGPKRVYEIWDNKERLQQGRDQVNSSQPEVDIKLGSQREDLWRDRDQENNLDKNKEEIDASYEKM